MMVQRAGRKGRGCTVTVYRWFTGVSAANTAMRAIIIRPACSHEQICRANPPRPQAAFPLGEPTGTLHGEAVKVA